MSHSVLIELSVNYEYALSIIADFLLIETFPRNHFCGTKIKLLSLLHKESGVDAVEISGSVMSRCMALYIFSF